jgi:hypothetical protein
MKHQRPHPKEPASVIPAYEERAVKKRGKTCKNTAETGSATAGTSESGVLDTESGTQVLGSETRKLDDGGFAAFWLAYPRKVGKGDALKSWRKLHPSPTLEATILTAVSVQKLSHDWRKESGRYVPNPATWLNQTRWEDELDRSPPSPVSEQTRENLAARERMLAKIGASG